jgi:hypothetical protein
MKKIFLITLLCLSLVKLKAQEGIVFKMQYMPNRTYKSTIGIAVKVNAEVTGSQSVIDKLKSQGISSPVEGNLAAGITGEMKTGSMGVDNAVPMDMEYKVSNISANANGKDFPIPPMVTEKEINIKGRITRDGQLQLVDSAQGKAVSDSTKARMQHIISMVQKEIRFPSRPLKVGDSFTDTIPIHIPGHGDSYMQANAKAVYKLVSVANGNAYFGVVPTFILNFKMHDATIDITGMGIGRLIYSIKDNFPISKETTMNIKIKVTSDKVNIDGTSTVTAHYTCTINQ